MNITPAQVRAIAPEFSSLGDPEITTFIGFAEDQMNQDLFGDSAGYAEMCLTAHLLSIAHPELAKPGAVASVTVGQVTIQRAIGQFTAEALSLSRHGLEYRRMMRLTGAGIQVL
jgi:hypothetical protein